VSPRKPPILPVLPTEALPAWHTLTAKLFDYRPPCASGVDGDMWFSRNSDEIEYAQRRCTACLAFDPCGAFADASDQRHGVWAAVNREAVTGDQEAAA
jgi:hypothetical protein